MFLVGMLCVGMLVKLAVAGYYMVIDIQDPVARQMIFEAVVFGVLGRILYRLEHDER